MEKAVWLVMIFGNKATSIMSREAKAVGSEVGESFRRAFCPIGVLGDVPQSDRRRFVQHGLVARAPTLSLPTAKRDDVHQLMAHKRDMSHILDDAIMRRHIANLCYSAAGS